MVHRLESASSLHLFILLLLILSFSSALSVRSYQGNTHPALESPDISSGLDVERETSTSLRSPPSPPSPPSSPPQPFSSSLQTPEEIAYVHEVELSSVFGRRASEARVVLGRNKPLTTSRNSIPNSNSNSKPNSNSNPVREEFYRNSRKNENNEIVVSSGLQNLVVNLKSQLKESQAAHIHTRSIINVLQEKVEAQENDLSIMKNEISQMKREQSSQRELVSSLKASTSDVSWAIASVKHGLDQTSSDVVSLKHLQDHQNETLLVIEEVIMSNAIELQNFHKNTANIRQDIFQLRSQMTDDQDKINKLQRSLHQLESRQKIIGLNSILTSGTSSPDVDNNNNNIIDENEDGELNNHLSPHNSAASQRKLSPSSSSSFSVSLDRREEEARETRMETIERKLADHDRAIEVATGFVSNLSDHVTSVDGKVAQMSQRQLLDSQLLQHQQSFMNYTSQIYHLEQWRANYADRELDNSQSEFDRDMASLIFTLENHSERIRTLENLALKYSATSNLHTQQQLNHSIVKLNATLHHFYRELEARVAKGVPTTADGAGEVLLDGGRMKEMEEWFKRTNEKMKEMEVMIFNVSLQHCKAVNDELVEEVKAGNFVKQIADVQMKISEQTTSLARLDRGLTGVFQELDKNTETSSSLNEQMNELKKLTPDVSSLQKELFNFVLQLPADCYDVNDAKHSVIHDGVYLIRPEGSRHSARAFCATDEDTIWTVVQRRTDGRESFARSWEDYKGGFGDPSGEFWLGNENIHRLTDGATNIYRLRVDMWDVLGRYWIADYTSFRLHSEDALYRLELGDFRGNATDALRYSNLMPFSALDRDNDVSTTHCAQFYQSGWWYKHCHYSNLNGRYTSGIVWFHQNLEEWIQMKQTIMRITRVPSTKDGSTHSLA